MMARITKARTFGAWMFEIPQHEDLDNLGGIPAVGWKVVGFRLGHFDSIESAGLAHAVLRHPSKGRRYVVAVGRGDHYLWEELKGTDGCATPNR